MWTQPPKFLNDRQLAATRERMLVQAYGALTNEITMHQSDIYCPTCPYAQLCEGALTGKDVEGMIGEKYVVEEGR